jgi:hypothetical protein
MNGAISGKSEAASTVRTFLAVLSWVVFAGGVIVGYSMWQKHQDALAEQQIRLKERKAELKQEWAGQLAEVKEKLASVKAALAAMQAAGEALEGEVKSAGDALAELDQKAEQLAAEAADVPGETPAPEEASAALAAAKKQVEDLTREKAATAAAYTATLKKLRATLISLIAGKDPEALQKFYLQYVKGPLGPAALFESAEAWYRDGETEKARKNYMALVATFVDSEYCKKCDERLDQIRAKKTFTPVAETDVILYHPLQPTGP